MTGVLNPEIDDTVMFTDPDAPEGIFTLEELTVTAKSGLGGGITSSSVADLMMVVWDLGVIVPVTVRLKAPDEAPDGTRIVSVVVADAPVSGRLVWFRFALTPVGTPERVSATVPDRPLSEYNVTREIPVLPVPTVRMLGTMETNRSGPLSLNTPSTEKCCIWEPVPVAMTPLPAPELVVAMWITLVPVDAFADANGTVNRVPFPANPGTMPLRDSFSSTNPGPVVTDEDTPAQPAVFKQ